MTAWPRAAPPDDAAARPTSAGELQRGHGVGTLPRSVVPGLAWWSGRVARHRRHDPAQENAMPTTTLDDVAAAARVSRSTASRVVRGAGRVSDEA
ncbi:LacI family DNA-binding transcriptional regulator, partial [Cellulosimicrobium cellulans]|uniref:LacI family DNA-binding transcriptional regulator n=1 Tax=Cellulosimicrobium cellulans TaxID=1710 RepID=UPI0029E7D1C4